MKPLIFLGQTFEQDEAFRKVFPAYYEHRALIRAGCDTPHKIELALYAKRKKGKRKGKKIGYSIRRKVA
jgi:hypothetical protein